MMASRSVRITALALTLALAAQSMVAIADVKSALDAMYMSNVTPPGFAKSQSRGMLSFGNASFRTPIQSVTVFSFDPPRIAAGCSGIDIHGGAFSLLSKDAITDLLRHLGASMIPLLFQYALEKIDSSMASQIKTFFNDLQLLGIHRYNSCKIAHALVDAGTKKGPSGASTEEDAEAKDTGSGGTKGFGDFVSDMFAGADRILRAVANVTTARTNPMMGNLTWNVLADSKAHLALAGFDEMTAARIMLSMMGTVVTTCNDGTSPTGKCQATDGSGKVSTPDSDHWKGPLTLHDFVLGPNSSDSGAKLQLLSCTNNDTVSADPVDISSGDPAALDAAMKTGCVSGMTKDDWDFPGTVVYVRAKFFGNSYDPQSGVPPEPSSIYGKLTGQCGDISGSDCSVSIDELRFLSSVGGDYMAMAKALRKSPMMGAYTEQLIPYASVAMGVRFGEAVMRAWRSAPFKRADMPGFMIDSENHLLAELSELRAQMQAMEPQLRTFGEAAAKVVANRHMQVGRPRV